MVQCPVGFRCKNCIKASTPNPPGTEVGPKMVAKNLALCGLIGALGGWAMPFIQIPYLSCFVCFFMGLLAGRWLSTKLDFRLGQRAPKVVVFGLLIGMSLSPLGTLPMMILQMLLLAFSSPSSGIFNILLAIVSALFCPVAYLVGVLRPTIWGHHY
jgi:hypothetical protein